MIRIDVNNVSYTEKIDNLLYLFLNDGNEVPLFNELVKKSDFLQNGFIQICQNRMVNTKHIKGNGLKKHTILLDTGREFKVSRRKWYNIKSVLSSINRQ